MINDSHIPFFDNESMYRIKILQHIYLLSMALSLTLHVFNMGGENGLKPFHIAAAISCALSFVMVPKKNKLFKYTIGLLICALISSAFSHSATALSGWINIFIVITSCYGLAFVNIDLLLKWLLIFIPIDLFFLFSLSISISTYRFQGFYNDPNYLCSTLLVFLYVSFLILIHSDNKFIRIVQVANIVIIFALVLMTLSRTGFICVVLPLFFVSYIFLKKKFFSSILIGLVAFFIIQHYAIGFLERQYDLLYQRTYENSDNLESAQIRRSGLSMQNIYYIIDHPQYVFFGLGAGTTAGPSAINVPGLREYRISPQRDHNTWTSCFSEQGLLALFFLSLIVIQIIKIIFLYRNSLEFYLSIGTVLSLLIFSVSIWQMTYLPYWWLWFFIANKRIYINTIPKTKRNQGNK